LDLAEPIIFTLLTEKWQAAIPIMQIFCFTRLLTIFSSTNINMLYVIGRSDLVLKQQYVAILARILLVGPALFFGIYYVALAELAATILHLFINSYYSGRKLGYPIWEQLRSMKLYFIASLLILIIVFLIQQIIMSHSIVMAVSIFLGGVLYYLIIKNLKPHDILFFKNLMSSYKK